MRNIAHFYGWGGDKAFLSARSPDPVMVVAGKDLFGAEPFDPFTCGAADFPPDIQSKLDEMQVSLLVWSCPPLTLLRCVTAGSFPAVQVSQQIDRNWSGTQHHPGGMGRRLKSSFVCVLVRRSLKRILMSQSAEGVEINSFMCFRLSQTVNRFDKYQVLPLWISLK